MKMSPVLIGDYLDIQMLLGGSFPASSLLLPPTNFDRQRTDLGVVCSMVSTDEGRSDKYFRASIALSRSAFRLGLFVTNQCQDL